MEQLDLFNLAHSHCCPHRAALLKLATNTLYKCNNQTMYKTKMIQAKIAQVQQSNDGQHPLEIYNAYMQVHKQTMGNDHYNAYAGAQTNDKNPTNAIM